MRWWSGVSAQSGPADSIRKRAPHGNNAGFRRGGRGNGMAGVLRQAGRGTAGGGGGNAGRVSPNPHVTPFRGGGKHFPTSLIGGSFAPHGFWLPRVLPGAYPDRESFLPSPQYRRAHQGLPMKCPISRLTQGKRLLLTSLTVALLGASGMTLFADSKPTAPVEKDHAAKMARGLALFKEQVRPVLTKRCLRCHGGKSPGSGP